MTTIGVCLDSTLSAQFIAHLTSARVETRAVSPQELAAGQGIAGLSALVVVAHAQVLTPSVLAACDRAGVRVVPYVTDERSVRLAQSLGLPALTEPRAEAVAAAIALRPGAVAPATTGPLYAVWGPHGAPGRTSIALALATELGRSGADICLVDADSHAPAVAQALGLSDDVPGLAGACWQSGHDRFTREEYLRLRTLVPAVGAGVSVLTGLNRPARWPELRAGLVRRVLTELRTWNDAVVVDTAAPLEADEALVSDLADDGLRRNAATITTLGLADHIIAVVGAEPVGIARFVRAIEDVRAIAPATPVTVIANRMRSSVVGIDARGQIRTALAQLAGIEQVKFFPDDRGAFDRAVLRAMPVNLAAPRSAVTTGVRRLAADLCA